MAAWRRTGAAMKQPIVSATTRREEHKKEEQSCLRIQN